MQKEGIMPRRPNPFRRGGPDEQTEEVYPFMYNTLQGEWAKLAKRIKESKLPQKDYISNCVAPFNQELKGKESQLIVSLTRRFSQDGFYSNHTVHLGFANLEEEVQIGLITNKTKIGMDDSISTHAPFVKDVDKAHHLDKNGVWSSNFEYSFREKGYALFLIAFHNEPPEGTLDYHTGGCFGGNVKTFTPTKKPRLEFFIGDEKAIPFMQTNLRGYEYQLASNLLEINLPLSEKLKEKIRVEQLELFEGISGHEGEFLLKNAKYNLLRDTAKSGAVPGVDEVCIVLNRSPEVNESKDSLLNLIRTAKERRYDLYGIETKVKVTEGVSLDLNLKDYFSSRINTYIKE